MDVSTRATHIRGIATTAVCASLIAVGSYVSVPIPWSPAPISLASMFVTLSGLLLGARRGACACLLYLALGAFGLPVFSGGTGGIAPLLGPTGGFLLGYPLSAFVAGLLYTPRNIKDSDTDLPGFPRTLFAALAAAAVLYVPGLLWLMTSLGLSFSAAASLATIPFLPGDILKAIGAAASARTLRIAGVLQE